MSSKLAKAAMTATALAVAAGTSGLFGGVALAGDSGWGGSGGHNQGGWGGHENNDWGNKGYEHHEYNNIGDQNVGGNGGGGGKANANCAVPIGVSLGLIGQGGDQSQCNAVGGAGGNGLG